MANQRANYVYGNVVTKPAYTPKPEKKPVKKQNRSPRTSKNVKRESQMNAGYVFFLAIASVITLFVCVNFINVQSKVTETSKAISEKQEELASLKEANNAKENAIKDSITLETVRHRAISELGMVYAMPEQIIRYDCPTSDIIEQVNNIPDKGTVVKSEIGTK
ncbi:cell division protein FtsL [Aequitasia blattaphilus]|uniref:Cell division protein FtsL n=1 Tax=Aequitasia blattaphilus TaxID=2949332 RepID=A0ABT1E693_9FIRM|nr:hypothetical protein [Aequitasia blattaphilus]MCP1101339.1 hypothetical protein [Aequitasia blattaphilus]MCR8613979.1 hypothetical protein [Aequitasia blattaphilus]